MPAPETPERASPPGGDPDQDLKWMARALALAREGEALAHPNPMVGAIVVAGGREVGRGFHTYDGVKHAEILALEEAGGLARGATLYLNLEPCCHTGRTGPCTDAILAAGIRRVVAAMPDPNPRVAGRGFEILRNAGVEVTSGILEEVARRLNETFTRWIRTGLPLVTLKAALTLDGKVAIPGAPALAGKTGQLTRVNRRGTAAKRRWITSEISRAEVQRMRHAADAVVTGLGTVLADDPLLTDRTGLPRRRPLVRVVLDSRLRLPLESRLVRSAAGDVLVLTRVSENSARAWALEQEGVETLCIARASVRSRGRRGAKGAAPGRQGLPLVEVFRALGELELLSVLLEAGPRLMAGALAAGVADKVVLFYAPRFLGGDALDMLPHSATQGAGHRKLLSAVPCLQNVTLQRFGPDFAVEGYLRDVYGDR
jgi:diaminohydroxyphosphoribosylaminopyrimidine deaminase/5-amino-6-(5-phosphoribosylamino)uracil reductase